MIHARGDYNRIQDPEGKIGEDEPVFLFRAKDVLAPVVLAKYVELLAIHRGQKEMIDSTLIQEQKMREWQRQNGCKLPDMPVVPVEVEHIINTVHCPKPVVDFSGWVGHRARMCGGDTVKITGGLTNVSISGSFERGDMQHVTLHWDVATGKDMDGVAAYDLVELLDGPTREVKKGG